VISPQSQHKVNRIVEEQFGQYELTERGLSAVHFKDETGLLISANISLHLGDGDLPYQIM